MFEPVFYLLKYSPVMHEIIAGDASAEGTLQ
jgi:hypothetical protein